jgi:hypothetical protein
MVTRDGLPPPTSQTVSRRAAPDHSGGPDGQIKMSSVKETTSRRCVDRGPGCGRSPHSRLGAQFGRAHVFVAVATGHGDLEPTHALLTQDAGGTLVPRSRPGRHCSLTFAALPKRPPSNVGGFRRRSP